MPDAAPDPLVLAVAGYVEAAYALKAAARAAHDDPPSMPLEHLLATLLDLREGQDAAAEAKALLGGVAYGLMPSNELNVPGLGVFRKVHGWDRKWDDDSLLDVLLKKVREIRRTPTYNPDGEVASEVQVLLELLRKAAAIGYWRMGALSELGLDADEFVTERKPKPKTVSLPRTPGLS